jgi:hypothetical protein
LGAFGDKLRKQREQRGIALDAISNTTKIGTRMLRALEDEHFDQLPGGVFNKGFVRAYARQVGLDEEEAITDYLAALRESQIQQQSILPDFRASAGQPNNVPPEPRQDTHTHDRHEKHRHDKDRHEKGRRDDARHDDARPSDHLPINDFRGNSGSQEHSQDRSHPVSAKDRRREDRRNRNQDLSQLLASAENAPAASPAASRFREKYPAGNPAQTADQLASQIPWTKLAAALLLVTLVLAVWSSRRRNDSSAHPAAASQPFPAPSPVPFAAPPSTATQPSASTSSPALQMGKQSPSAPLSAGTLSTATISAGAAHPTSISAPPTAPAVKKPSPSLGTPSPASSLDATTSSSNKPIANSPGITPAVAQQTIAAAAAPPAAFTLLIRAEKTTWVSIVADGKPVTQETLIAPAHTSVRASGEVIVKVGNAAGISFQLNGKEFPAGGNEGEVKIYTFDATGLRPPTQSQPTATNP